MLLVVSGVIEGKYVLISVGRGGVLPDDEGLVGVPDGLPDELGISDCGVGVPEDGLVERVGLLDDWLF